MSDTSTPAPAPADPAPAPPPAMTPADCAQQLKQRFPALFTGPVKPLKLKIQADIQQRAPGLFSRQVLSAFFRRHTGSTSYLIALTKAPHRFDLDGQPAGEISDEHRQVAAEELARRRATHEARREQDEQQRRERAQLLRDFERTTLTPANFCALKGLTPEQLDALLAQARQEAAERPPAPGPQHERRPGGPGMRPARRDGQGPRRDASRGPDTRGPRGPRPQARPPKKPTDPAA